MEPDIALVACRALCVVLVALEVADMVRAARDEAAPAAMRAACIVGDGVIMYLGTQLLWWPPFL